MEDIEHAFGTAIFILDHTLQKTSAKEALRTFGDVTQENFWRMWPEIRDWAEDLWHEIEDERGLHASPVVDQEDGDQPETGGSG